MKFSTYSKSRIFKKPSCAMHLYLPSAESTVPIRIVVIFFFHMKYESQKEEEENIKIK